jgi:hypothetical protein
MWIYIGKKKKKTEETSENRKENQKKNRIRVIQSNHQHLSSTNCK